MAVVDNDNIEDFSEMEESFNNIKKDSKIFVSHSLSIPEYVDIILENRPRNFIAQQLKVSEAQVSKWLTGSSNMTLRTISKLEAALDIKIINPQILIEVKKHHNVSDTPVIKMNPSSYQEKGTKFFANNAQIGFPIDYRETSNIEPAKFN